MHTTKGVVSTNPVIKRLGRDLATLVYKHVHASNWKQVNKEYYDCIVPEDSGLLRYMNPIQHVLYLWNRRNNQTIKRFNYRDSGGKWQDIFVWDLFKQKPDYTRIKIPKNYW